MMIPFRGFVDRLVLITLYIEFSLWVGVDGIVACWLGRSLGCGLLTVF